VARNNDLMTALLDTRRALEEQFAVLGERVESARREVTDTVTTRTADLHADNRETRNRVNSLSTALSETTKSVPALRQEVADLALSFRILRDTVDELAARLPGAPGEPPVGTSALNSTDRDQTPPGPGFPVGVEAPAEPDLRAEKPAEMQESRPDDIVLQAEQRRAACADPLTAQDSAHDTDTPDRRADSAGARSLAQHDNVLRSAATVGTVDIACHRELWEFIHERAADIAHFRAPAALVEEGQDRVRATLSGRSVIGVLIAMRATQTESAPYGKDDGTWTLSHAVYDRLAHDLTTTSRQGATPLAVVFDDGAGTEAEPAA